MVFWAFTLRISILLRFERMRFTQPNPIAGVGAGNTPEFIEMNQVGASHKSGSARLADR
jgi:hypothetical protein